jgi:two-component system, NtrC family, nitrogen regulation sensor histidine kinase NtrY
MILDRKQLLILWIGLGLLTAAFLWDAVYSGDRNMYRYQGMIESHLQQQERAVEPIINDKAFLERRLNVVLAGEQFDEDVLRVANLQKESYNVCIFKNDSAVFWTRNDVLPRMSDFGKGDTVVGQIYSKLVEWKQSQYELRYSPMPKYNEESAIVAVLIPIKRIYGSFEGEYLKNHYLASPLIPPMMELAEGSKNKFTVQTKENKVLCSLVVDLKNEADRLHDIGMIIFLALGLFMLGKFGDRMAKQMLAQNESPMMGILFFIGTLVALRATIYFVEGSALFPTTDLQMAPYSNAIFIHSLSELIINTIFLFWFAIFFNKEFRLPDFKQQPIVLKWSLSAGCYAIVVLLNILSIGIFNDLVSHWKNIVTFESLTDFNTQTVVAILSMSLIQMAVFLISHRLIASVRDLEMNKWQLFLAQDVAIGIGALLYESYSFTDSLPIWGYVFFLFVYISIFHKFLTYKVAEISWLVLWVIIFAAIQAFFVSRLSIDKDQKNLYKYARDLANERDRVAEGHIRNLVDTIDRDPFIHISGRWPFRLNIDPEHIRAQIKLFLEMDDYLNDHYSMRLTGINRTGEAVINQDSIKLKELQQQLTESYELKNECNCRFWTNKLGGNAYLASITIPLRKDNPLIINMTFTRVDKMSSRIFTEILADKHYKKIPQLNEYSYVIYKNGVSVEQNQHGIYDPTIKRSQLPPPGTSIYEIIGNQGQVTYQANDNIAVRISKYIPVSSQGFTLFIYFILVLTVVMFILTVINHYYPFLPEVVSMSYSQSSNTSLRYRIMIPVIGFILFSYGVVFAFTFFYYKKVGDKFNTGEFENKAKTIISNIKKDFKDPIQNDPELLNACLSRQSDNDEMALHYFNPEGVLMGTTEKNIFDKGILAYRMNPTAYMNLRRDPENIYRTEENIGDFHYKSSFYTIKDSTGKQIKGFVELPFYSRDRNLKLTAGDMWAYSAGVLTFLFILCISIISMHTARLIAPLQHVADTLRRLQVGKTVKNEIITWDKKDEIGALINAYNTKVSELEEMIMLLAEAEREGAWRDMARQVAHEIRNPLTPMKLVVQHLEMMRLQGNSNMAEYTSRSNRVLLEQIASLEKIVNEFHSFARMPNKATNQNFPLNDLVQSVADLFAQHNNESKKLEVTMTMPNEMFIVYADRALLTSAFNNLIKNAIQSIPPDRDGIIKINLYREENTAILKISDNGSGIPKDIQDKIFSPNFTTKAYGSGIGLLITKNIIQSVSGKISFETIENEGSDFFVQLEIVESYAAEAKYLTLS